MPTLRSKNMLAKLRRRRARRVRIGAPDHRLTDVGGVETIREIDRVLGITSALTIGIGSIKKRDQGLNSGQTVMTMASAQLAGEDHIVGLDGQVPWCGV